MLQQRRRSITGLPPNTCSGFTLYCHQRSRSSTDRAPSSQGGGCGFESRRELERGKHFYACPFFLLRLFAKRGDQAVEELPEHEERRVREYVNGQLRGYDDPVALVQKIGSRRMEGRLHPMYDVRTERGARWWVIGGLMNLYSQDDFHSIDMAFTYHLGVEVTISERQRQEPRSEEDASYFRGAWRRFEQAAEMMDSADESEQFQAVGVRCRESLLALIRELVKRDGSLASEDGAPQMANFKDWVPLLARSLGEGRVRSYLTTIAEKTWDLCVWLQHNVNATPWDADLVLAATVNVLDAFAYVVRKQRDGAPFRCPECSSYRVRDDGVLEERDGRNGWHEWKVCASCEWQSSSSFRFLDERLPDSEAPREITDSDSSVS